MKTIFKYFFLIFLIFFIQKNDAQSIRLHVKDATAWLPQQTITGELKDFNSARIIIHQDESQFSQAVKNDGSFTFNLTLHDAKNKIWVEANKGSSLVTSDTVNLTLGFHPQPVIQPYAVVGNSKVTLHTNIIQNPWIKAMHFLWSTDKNNPAKTKIINTNDSLTKVFIPNKSGVYYFKLLVTSGKDTAYYKTFVTRKDNGLHAFDLTKEHADWIDSSVMYEITPSFFVFHGKYTDITQKLSEIKQLGINTIWLQPVFKNEYGDQGYDITDYFSLRDDLGTEQQLQHLVTSAKALHMRVLFDFVPNHTSVDHPYAKDCIQYGTNSHYYNFYQRTYDGATYSSLYNTDENGFVYYFWNGLVNLNYKNPEVQQWIIEACKYWINKFDIDGYRFDAMWGVNAREPEFANKLQLELKSIKPDLLLLAEDKGSLPKVYHYGFDVAYDWAADTLWISHWNWQYDYSRKKDLTIFNYPDENKRGKLLRDALFNNDDSMHLRLRFLENNDLPRFIESLELKRTKMAAALMFALPGIPLIYNGQEIGFTRHPYSSDPIFLADQTIQSLDKENWFPYYQKLITIRNEYKSLWSKHIEEVPVKPSASVVAFHRWKINEHFIVVINLSSSPDEAHLQLNGLQNLQAANNYTLIDVLNNDTMQLKYTDLSDYVIHMDEYSTKLILLKDDKINFSSQANRILSKDNNAFTVYPNPAKSFINIVGSLSKAEFLHISIEDVAGKECFVKDTNASAGNFSTKILLPVSAGIYFVMINDGKNNFVKKVEVK